MIINGTPLEKYLGIWVKREDMSCEPPGPPFSKVRGLYQHLKKLKAGGIEVVGYTETSISMAGWGVAWVCEQLGMTAVIYDPQYKKTPPLLKFHRKQWKKFNAEIVPIKAGMARVNWNISRNLLRESHGERAILLPLGLPLEESIEGTARECYNTLRTTGMEFNSIVVNVGSGTIAAGVWSGANMEFMERVAGMRDRPQGPVIYGIMGRTGDKVRKMKTIEKKAGLVNAGFLAAGAWFQLVDPGWEYTDKSNFSAPFPCHPYYDLKAWEWLLRNRECVADPVLFWNIGR